MAYADLREFIAALEKNQELKRIPFEVDPILEITEFADRAVKAGGPALLFEKPKGYSIPVLINSYASMRKMQIALEVDSVETVAQRISEYLEMRMPEGLIGKLKMLPKLAEMGSFFPKIVSKGPCQEVVRTTGFSLNDYPVLTCWPEDGGRFITLPLVLLAQSRHRQAQLRHVPHAGLRRAHRGHALADAQAGRRALPPHGRRRPQAHGRRGGHRRRPRHHVFGHPAPAAGSGRNDDRRASCAAVPWRW